MVTLLRSGVRNPGRICIHTDAVQAPGHVPLDLQALGVDFLTLGGHKFHGPTGVGLLYCRDPGRLHPLHCGGGQEGGLRPGTPSVPLIRAFVTALRDAELHRTERLPVLRQMFGWGTHPHPSTADHIWSTLAPYIVTGLVLPTGAVAPGERAVHHVSFCVRNVSRDTVLQQLETRLLLGGHLFPPQAKPCSRPRVSWLRVAAPAAVLRPTYRRMCWWPLGSRTSTYTAASGSLSVTPTVQRRLWNTCVPSCPRAFGGGPPGSPNTVLRGLLKQRSSS